MMSPSAIIFFLRLFLVLAGVYLTGVTGNPTWLLIAAIAALATRFVARLFVRSWKDVC
ncbi:MAG: hypothetical protein KJ587_18760 [Alphaproteobacteria bacterium]|nr:hypothetical protein [Alphaproteobacteria bacterium]